ncbi:hypothetical protein AAMO2058_000519400 [Amorphochlora amoebiformis]
MAAQEEDGLAELLISSGESSDSGIDEDLWEEGGEGLQDDNGHVDAPNGDVDSREGFPTMSLSSITLPPVQISNKRSGKEEVEQKRGLSNRQLYQRNLEENKSRDIIDLSSMEKSSKRRRQGNRKHHGKRTRHRLKPTREQIRLTMLCHMASIRVLIARHALRSVLCHDQRLQAIILSQVPPALIKLTEKSTSAQDKATIAKIVGWVHSAWKVDPDRELASTCAGQIDQVIECLVGQLLTSFTRLQGPSSARGIALITLTRALGFRTRYVVAIHAFLPSPQSLFDRNFRKNTQIPPCPCKGGDLGGGTLPARGGTLPARVGTLPARGGGGSMVWGEVHLHGKWVDVHVDSNQISTPTLPAKMAMTRVKARGARGRERAALLTSYVVGFGGGGGGGKDVTRRYSTHWSLVQRWRRRVSQIWWTETLNLATKLESLLSTQTSRSQPSQNQSQTSFQDQIRAETENESGEHDEITQPTEQMMPSSSSEVAVSARWSCQRCTFSNKGHSIVCVMCGTAREIRGKDAILEDNEMEKDAPQEPIPLTLGECKKNASYAVEKFIGKYEVIYPKGPEHVVGTIISKGRAYPVYRRSHVRILHSRDRWIREMREVKLGAIPIKSVAKRKSSRKRKSVTQVTENYNLESGGMEKSSDNDKIDLFGKWQTIAWKTPKVSEQGKIPRGKHGHVELWTKSHVPEGCVHVDRPRVASVAKKLGIEYAPAMTGFEMKSGRSVPVISGIVVHKRDSDIVVAAAKQLEAERLRKQAESKKRALRNAWRDLIRRLTIRQKVFSGEAGAAASASKKKPKNSRKSAKIGTQGSVGTQGNLGSVRGKKGGMGLEERHVHVYPEHLIKYDEASGMWSKTCSECDMVVKWEEL